MRRIGWLIRGIVALLAVGFLTAPLASGEPTVLVISTGKERGSYYYIGQRLKAELVVEHNQLSEVLTSRGSLHNLSLLDGEGGPVNVALSQADALDLYLADHPEFSQDVIVLGDLGRECAFIIAARDGPGEASELKQGSGKISVDDLSSGAAVTWRNMTRIEPAFAASVPDTAPTMEALLQLDVGRSVSDLRAVMLVGRPRRVSPPLELALAKPDRYRFVSVRASDLPNVGESDGKPIYSFERVRIGGEKRKNGVEVETLCTRGLMLGSKSKLGYELRSRLSELMVKAGDRIVGEDE